MLALEVVAIPVADLDRSLEFYSKRCGFVVDVDYRPSASFQVIQLTPPGSRCSIHLVQAESSARLGGLYLVTDDLERERDKLMEAGVPVQAIRRKDVLATWAGGFAPGIDPERRNYASFADFADPDGNVWTIQERGYDGARTRTA